MAKIFITGSADGLGFLAGKELLANGHDVIYHARNEARAQSTVDRLGRNVDVLIGYVSQMTGKPFPQGTTSVINASELHMRIPQKSTFKRAT